MYLCVYNSSQLLSPCLLCHDIHFVACTIIGIASHASLPYGDKSFQISMGISTDVRIIRFSIKELELCPKIETTLQTADMPQMHSMLHAMYITAQESSPIARSLHAYCNIACMHIAPHILKH